MFYCNNQSNRPEDAVARGYDGNFNTADRCGPRSPGGAEGAGELGLRDPARSDASLDAIAPLFLRLLTEHETVVASLLFAHQSVAML
jgi:hypothetical protein